MACSAPSPTITVAPKQAPLALDDAKRFLRVEHTDFEDKDIEDLILAAAEFIRTRTETTLVQTTYESLWEEFPEEDEFDLAYPPVVAATIQYYDVSNVLQTFDSGSWSLVNTGYLRSRICLASNAIWPTTYLREDAVKIAYVAGYGTGPDSMPALVRHAMRLAVRHFYDKREAVVSGGSRAAEMSLESILNLLSTGRFV